ncbi:MAG TPA: Crp/Fnr family transcriptional regulator [Bacillota bacterium]
MFTKWRRQLTECSLFAGVELEDLNVMLQCLNPVVKEFQKDECLTVAGQDFNGVGVILEGEVMVTKENSAGHRIIVMTLGAGDMFGEMVAFSGERKWPATVIAQREGKVMFLPPEKIVGNCRRQCASHRLLITNMLKILSDRALFLNKKMEYLSMKSLRGKICAFLLEQYKKYGATTFLLPLNRNEWADFLNVARPSLSRELGKMKEEGLLDYHRASIKIKNLEAVRKMAE